MRMSRTIFCAVLTARVMTAAAIDSDTQSMNTVYVRWGSPTQLASWGASSGQTACNMTGITCNTQSKVVSLSLYNIPTGTFDPLLFSLTSLSSIALVQVNLIGSIPAQISQLTGLQTLQTSNNLLAGSLPLSLSLLVMLTAMDMNSNQLTGTIPPQLSTLTLLCQLQLANNKFSGYMPSSLSALKALVNFYAPFNSLSGPIPAQYSALQQLTTLFLSSNTLTNSIPAQLTSIGNLSVSVNHNPAMCGPPLAYGQQATTNIGHDCPNSKAVSVETIFSAVIGSILGMLLIATLSIYCTITVAKLLARRAAASVIPYVEPLNAIRALPIILIQPQPPPQPQQATRSEMSRFFMSG